MGLPLLQEESGGSARGIKGIVTSLVNGDKYDKLNTSSQFSIDDDDFSSADSPALKEIELELIASRKKKPSNYKVLQEIEEDDFKLDDEDEPTGKWAGLIGKLKKIQEKHILKIAWGCTVLGIMCTAWIAPCFKLLGSEGVAPARRASWRSQVLLMLLFVPAYLDFRSLTAEQRAQLKDKTTLLQLLVCALLWFFDLFLWSNGLEYTTVSRASIFANSSSLMILIYCLIRRMPISFLEIGGGIIGFGGMVFAVVGTNLISQSESEAAAKNPILGDIFSLASALCVAAYVLNASKARAKVTVFVYTFSNTLFLVFALSIASIAVEGTKFDTTVNGLFGWVNPHFLMVVALLSFVAGLIGFNLNNMSLKYVPPLGYSLLGLCDPFISGTYAWIIGADGIPGIFTFLGGVITIGGIVTLMVGQEKRKQKENLQKLVEESEESVNNENNAETVNKQLTTTDEANENNPTTSDIEKHKLIEPATSKVVAFSVSDEP